MTIQQKQEIIKDFCHGNKMEMVFEIDDIFNPQDYNVFLFKGKRGFGDNDVFDCESAILLGSRDGNREQCIEAVYEYLENRIEDFDLFVNIYAKGNF